MSSESNSGTKAEKKPSILSRIEQHVQRRMLDGLMDLMPLLATAFVIALLAGYADGLVRGLPFISGTSLDFWGSGLIVMVVAFYLVGLLVSTRWGRKVSSWKGALFGSIPIVKVVFNVTQQAMASMTSQYRFTRVVFVEWPREGMAALGFVTARVRDPRTQDTLVLVYIPTIPNPTSGNMALVVEDDVLETDLTVDMAMKLVFSGGIVTPSEFSLARVPGEEARHRELLGRFTAEE
ncbi:MAG: DUF502 domain-containing protein [Chloroflexota bacterium]|nr:DUF502 domain-containing protein [Chloroflexota bacterium]